MERPPLPPLPPPGDTRREQLFVAGALLLVEAIFLDRDGNLVLDLRFGEPAGDPAIGAALVVRLRVRVVDQRIVWA